MARSSRAHSSDEFRKQGSGSAGPDAPTTGAAGALTDGESGVAPPRPHVLVRALAIVLALMLALAVTGVALVMGRDRATTPDSYRLACSRECTGTMNGELDDIGPYTLGFTTGPALRDDLDYDSATAFLINGRPLNLGSWNGETLTVYDLYGWTCTIDYVRVVGAKRARATRVAVTATGPQIQDAIDQRRHAADSKSASNTVSAGGVR